MKTWEIIWVAVGTILTTATKLRPTTLPLGPGEVMLAIWMLLVGIRIVILRHRYLITFTTRVFFWFWLVAFISLALGLLSAESMGLTSEEFYHDAFAFGLAFSFSMSFLIWVSSNKDLKKVLLFSISFTIVSLSILFLFPGIIPSIDPWYSGVRFAAWSKDPNQLALLLSPMPFFALHLFNLSSNKYEKLWYVLLMLGAFTFGIATQSDSLRLWWTVAISVTIFLMLYREISRRIIINFRPYTYRTFTIKQITLLSLLLITLLLGFIVYQKIYGVVSDVYSYGAQGTDRLNLWGNGIAALSHSPLFGLGPGAHSGYTGPFLDVEAHNTFIDWATSYGIIGLICYLALLGWVGWNAWKNGSTALVAAFISLIGYGVFVYTMRHIIFWFSLLIIARLSTSSLNQKSTNNRKRVPSDFAEMRATQSNLID